MNKLQKIIAASIMGFSFVFAGVTEASASKYVSVLTYSGGTKYLIEKGYSKEKEKKCLVKVRNKSKKQQKKCVNLFSGNPSYMYLYKRNGVYRVSQGYPRECGAKITNIPGMTAQFTSDPCSDVTSLSDAARKFLKK